MVLPLALVLAAPASAQQTPSPPSQSPPTTVQGVTVTAKPEPQKPTASAYSRALSFIESQGQTAQTGKIARWDDPVCPMTLGLSPDQAKFISYRVRHVADLVGAPRIRGNTCQSNVEIVFTAEPQKLLDAVAAKRSAYLGYHHIAEAKQLAAVTHPIQGWYLTATRGAGGATAEDVAAGNLGSMAGAPGSAESAMNAGNSPSGCAGSRISDCRSSQFANILIVVDANRLQDVKIGQIADYVAFLALAQMKPVDKCGPNPTILDLLSTDCTDRSAPTGLTETDLGYLKGLYNAERGVFLGLQRSQIADTMTQAPAKPPAPPK
jgi:hypothetical protein